MACVLVFFVRFSCHSDSDLRKPPLLSTLLIILVVLLLLTYLFFFYFFSIFLLSDARIKYIIIRIIINIINRIILFSLFLIWNVLLLFFVTLLARKNVVEVDNRLKSKNDYILRNNNRFWWWRHQWRHTRIACDLPFFSLSTAAASCYMLFVWICR